jgi:hypothetical protein
MNEPLQKKKKKKKEMREASNGISRESDILLQFNIPAPHL